MQVVLLAQGRQKTWLYRNLGISRIYLYRIMLKKDNPQHSPAPPDFWKRVASLLGVPVGWLTKGLPIDYAAWASEGLEPEQAEALAKRLTP